MLCGPGHLYLRWASSTKINIERQICWSSKSRSWPWEFIQIKKGPRAPFSFCISLSSLCVINFCLQFFFLCTFRPPLFIWFSSLCAFRSPSMWVSNSLLCVLLGSSLFNVVSNSLLCVVFFGPPLFNFVSNSHLCMFRFHPPPLQFNFAHCLKQKQVNQCSRLQCLLSTWLAELFSLRQLHDWLDFSTEVANGRRQPALHQTCLVASHDVHGRLQCF